MTQTPNEKIELEKEWKDALRTLRVTISQANFSTWLGKTFIISVKDLENQRRVVEIGCPSSFVADGIEKRYFGVIQDVLNQQSGKKNDLVFTVKQKDNIKPETIQPLFASEEKNDEELGRAFTRSRVRPGFTFTNFAVSSSNQMAHAAAEAVSRNLGSAYNPLFLYGGVGVGKTHLMLAIAHYTLEKDPETKVLYCMGEEFTNEIVDAIRNKTTSAFKNKYRKLKLLMVDDVQFIAGKNSVQEEFFHTFNTLQREGGQVVLTSDRPPHEIEKLEERLKSRFEAGLIIDISPPDFELRSAIALIKAKEKNLELSMPVAQLIAANIDSLRRIEGFLTKLITHINFTKEEITTEVVGKLLGSKNKELKSFAKSASPQEVINAVSNYYSLGKRRLLGENRSQIVAFPRQILMYLLRTELQLPLQEVGRLVGGRDHTTVMHAVDKISKNLSINSGLREDISGIKKTTSV